MEHFSVPNELKKLNTTYPDAELLSSVAKNGGQQARQAIARQWLSEGIPFAFKDCPGIYESIRVWLGTRLQVDPKHIGLTGSAKIGQSLNPRQIGKPFNENSDLDLFVISESLFEKLVIDFNAWSFDFESSEIVPSNEREKSFWRENIQRGPKNISKGFLDSKLVPNKSKYSHICNVSQTMWLLTEKLKITSDTPKIKSASIRSYRNWESYVSQISLSLL
jgi:hypothetical protein